MSAQKRMESTKIPLIILWAIWSKSASLLQSTLLQSIVLSRTTVTLPMLCNPREVASMPVIETAHIGFHTLYTHTVTVAQQNNFLGECINWYVSSAAKPNFTTLAMSGMLPGKGQKQQGTEKMNNNTCSISRHHHFIAMFSGRFSNASWHASPSPATQRYAVLTALLIQPPLPLVIVDQSNNT